MTPTATGSRALRRISRIPGRANRSGGQLHVCDPQDGSLVQGVLETIARDESITIAAALTRMAEIALVALTDRDQPPRPLRGDERAAVVIHLEATQFPAEDPAAPPAEQSAPAGTEPRSRGRDQPSAQPVQPAARIADGPGLPLSVVLWLACSGRVRTVLRGKAGSKGQQRGVLDLGRTHRVVTVRLFHALLLRDGGCSHPGCRSRAGLEAHHVRHWLWGGLTRPENLVLLCSRHHHAHHAGEFSIAVGRLGEFRFFRADGRELEQVVDPTCLAGRDEPIEDEHPDVTPDAATSQWRGERLDRDWAVSVLAQRRRRATGRVDEKTRWDDVDPWSRTA